MDILKYRGSDKSWIALYVNYLKNCLLKGNNLSDLTDRTEALRNLDLVGEISSHTHDNAYDKKGVAETLYNKVRGELDNAVQELKKSLTGVSAKVDEITSSTGPINDLQNQLDDLNSKKLDQTKFLYVSGDKNNYAASSYPGSVVFICGGSSPHIEVSNGSSWIAMGAVWK